MDPQMINGLLFALTFISALSCGLMAGVFFAFSAFVMNGLSRLSATQSIAAMQFINAAAFNPLFAAAFCGTTAACVLLAIASLFMWHKSAGIFHLAGSLLYLVAAILVTLVFNLPLNGALAAVDATSADGTNLWAGYFTSWMVWNHVRTVGALAAAASLTIALLSPRNLCAP
jgi:uncharacterized membrane protein